MKYCICCEKTTHCLSIRVDTDCSPVRFDVLSIHDTFEEADAALRFYLD